MSRPPSLHPPFEDYVYILGGRYFTSNTHPVRTQWPPILLLFLDPPVYTGQCAFVRLQKGLFVVPWRRQRLHLVRSPCKVLQLVPFFRSTSRPPGPRTLGRPTSARPRLPSCPSRPLGFLPRPLPFPRALRVSKTLFYGTPDPTRTDSPSFSPQPQTLISFPPLGPPWASPVAPTDPTNTTHTCRFPVCSRSSPVLPYVPSLS